MVGTLVLPLGQCVQVCGWLLQMPQDKTELPATVLENRLINFRLCLIFLCFFGNKFEFECAMQHQDIIIS